MPTTEVVLPWNVRVGSGTRVFDLEKLEKAWAVSQETPVKTGAKLGNWLAQELKKYPELFDEELFESSMYAVVIEMKLWSPDGR